MSKNLKQRISTSFGLIGLLIMMFLFDFALYYIIILVGILSVLEFIKVILIIFKKEKFKKFFSILIFSIYIFTFLSLITLFSSFLHLKILIFLILLICIASDIGGFISGNIFKGAKLTKISPKKTISGSIGSLVFSVISSIIFSYYFMTSFDIYFLLVGLTTSIACQVGDLFFSYLKRKSNIKDFGNILPGHGGILDRIDGLLLGVPVGYLTVLIIY